MSMTADIVKMKTKLKSRHSMSTTADIVKMKTK